MKEKTTVDGELEQEEGDWTFDEKVADQFDEHVRKSIPLYDEIQTRVIKLSDWFVQSEGDEHIYDLGCATGTTIQRLVERHGANPPPKYVGIDLQAPMLNKARQRVGHEDAVNLLQADISTHMTFPNAVLVISLFTLSFVREENRKKLIEQIYEDLEYGGAFIFCEKTRAKTPHFQDIWNEEYWDFKAEQGLDNDEIIGKAKTLRGQLRPLMLSEYEELLDEAGFDVENNVDVFFKWFQWTGVIARKS